MPAKIVHPYTYEDVASAVRDHMTYPSPVRALGNIHTVTYVTVNQGGTVILMRNLRGVKEFKFDERFGHQTVTVLGGTTALEMYTWLGEKGFEGGFQAEIGDATLGSLAVSQSKDSGLTPRSEMGSTYKGIVAIKYVDHEGNIVDINAKDNAEALAWFKCSDGLLGIVLEVTYKVFPQRLVSMKYYSAPTADVIANIHNLVTEDKTVWMLLAADSTTVETREYAAPGVEHTPAMCRVIKEAKQIQFQHGELLIPDTFSRNVPLYYTCYRRESVVSYYNPNPGMAPTPSFLNPLLP
jgi:FAD/FMN-containing dehydrogenase